MSVPRARKHDLPLFHERLWKRHRFLLRLVDRLPVADRARGLELDPLRPFAEGFAVPALLGDDAADRHERERCFGRAEAGGGLLDSQEVLGAREDRLGALGFGARLPDRIGEEGNVELPVVGGPEGQVADRDLGQLQHRGDALQDVDRHVRPLLQGGKVTAADVGELGEPGLRETFADASFPYCISEHSKELIRYCWLEE
jgi:hypothetical protein